MLVVFDVRLSIFVASDARWVKSRGFSPLTIYFRDHYYIEPNEVFELGARETNTGSVVHVERTQVSCNTGGVVL